MQLQYVVRRPVRILGRDYRIGDVLDDPEIPGRILAAMVNTRRVEQRIGDGTIGRQPVPRDARAAPRGQAPARQPVAEGPEEEIAASEPLNGAVRGRGRPPKVLVPPEPPLDPAYDLPPVIEEDDGVAITTTSWRERWQASGTASTFRQWLQAVSAERGLSQNGSVLDLISRLDRDGVTADGVDY